MIDRLRHFPLMPSHFPWKKAPGSTNPEAVYCNTFNLTQRTTYLRLLGRKIINIPGNPRNILIDQDGT